MYTVYTQPNTYSAGYSAMPLQLYSDESSNAQSFKYTVNILYDKFTVTGSSSVSVNGRITTKLDCSDMHNFSVGDVVFFNDTSNNTYSGNYIIKSIPSTSSLIINLEQSAEITGNTIVSHVLGYKVNKDLDGRAKLDISNPIKDFLTEDLQDVNDIFEASSTKFEYDLDCGYESKYVFNFTNTVFTGLAGFRNATMSEPDIDNIPFQVGDEILIEQNLFEWEFDNPYNNGGFLSFFSADAHSFRVGQQVTITGQQEQSFNGVATIKEIGSSNPSQSITLYKPYISGTTGGGVAFGVPRPEYNSVARIEDIYYQVGLGVVIKSNIPWAGDSQTLTGRITFADGRVSEFHNQYTITGNTAYNAKQNKSDYSIDGFDDYVLDASAGLKNISTILADGNNLYRIEKSTKSWLLAHSQPNNLVLGKYSLKDANDDLLSTVFLTSANGALKDFYFPVGLNQLLNSSNTFGGSINQSIVDSTTNYEIELTDAEGTPLSHSIKFEINTDCSRYELFHLTWKDARGSWISYPFKYVSNENTEIERKNFYQSEGKWNNSTFDYDSFGRGEKTYFTRSRDKYTLNTGWIEEYENDLIKDLMTSTSVYVQLPDDKLIGCQILDTNFKKHKDNQDYLTNYTLTIALARNENRY